jgi:cell division protein FtsQ
MRFLSGSQGKSGARANGRSGAKSSRNPLQNASARKPSTRRRQQPRWHGYAVKLGAAIVLVTGLGAGLGWATKSGVVGQAWDATATGIERATVQAGLRVDEVLVAGRSETLRDDLLIALDVERGMPILSIDLLKARDRVTALPWVKAARVERRLPDTIYVEITERVPLALWQRQGVFTLIDQDGDPIHGRSVRRFGHLPIIVGDGAPERARAALVMLSAEPALARRVKALTWIGNRRWTVLLEEGISVELPENEPANAWARLASLERERGVLKADVHTVDLRVPDQLIFRTSPETVERVRAPGRST